MNTRHLDAAFDDQEPSLASRRAYIDRKRAELAARRKQLDREWAQLKADSDAMARGFLLFLAIAAFVFALTLILLPLLKPSP